MRLEEEEMKPTHALTTDNICEPTEEQLADKVANGSCDLDTEVLVCAELAMGVVDVAQHRRSNVDSEDVVAGR